jgi:DHA1 family inner membrane transport protein
MGAAVNQSAMNVANSLGAALGGVVIARGHGYLAPTWVGLALAAGGLGLAALSFATERRRPTAKLEGAGSLPGEPARSLRERGTPARPGRR